MKRRILLVVAVLFICVGIFVLIKFATTALIPQGRGGLQVTSNIKANVFINERPIGATPLSLSEADQTLAANTYNLRIVPEDQSMQPYVAKVSINPGVLTAVDRIFLPGALSSSYILTLEKTNSEDAQVFISTVPDGSLVLIDGQSQGVTPLQIDSISASEHEVEIQKTGFAKKTVRIRAVPNYKLVLNAVLGTAGSISENLPTASPTTPVSTPAKTPTQSPVVVILQTPVGFLRVREQPSTTADEIGRVNPGDELPYIGEQGDWYEITIPSGENGFVSKTYADLKTSN